MLVGGQRHTPAALPPGMTRYPGGWVDPRAGPDGSGISHASRDLISGPFSP